jgi:hypothetical protein
VSHRVAEALLEPRQLLGLADVQIELQDARSAVGEILLELVDPFVALGPRILRDETVPEPVNESETPGGRVY